jgi:hypothetical protein
MSEVEGSAQIPNWPRIKISKLEIARQQLNAAIRCYFLESDPVPTLTLAGAAHQIVKDLAGSDHKGVVLDNPEEIGEGFFEAFRYPYTSLKHADRKPDEILEFPTELAELYIYEAVEKYYFLVGKYSLEMLVFLLWYNVILNRDDLFPNEPGRSYANAFAESFPKNRAGFFNELTRPGVLPDIDWFNERLALDFDGMWLSSVARRVSI